MDSRMSSGLERNSMGSSRVMGGGLSREMGAGMGGGMSGGLVIGMTSGMNRNTGGMRGPSEPMGGGMSNRMGRLPGEENDMSWSGSDTSKSGQGFTFGEETHSGGMNMNHGGMESRNMQMQRNNGMDVDFRSKRGAGVSLGNLGHGMGRSVQGPPQGTWSTGGSGTFTGRRY